MFDLVKLSFQGTVMGSFPFGIEADAIKASSNSHVCILVSGWSEHELDLVKNAQTYAI